MGGGAFVRFGEEGFEGFLPARTHARRLVVSSTSMGTALVGERSGKTMRLGDPVEVAVRSVDAPRGRVDLVPARDGSE